MIRNVMVCIPSARGIAPVTVSCLFNLRTVLEKSGRSMAFSTLHRMPLDFARNELACAFVNTTCDAALLVDDDVQIEPWSAPEGVLTMIHALEGGCDVVSAPCRLRSHDGNTAWTPFNVYPTGGVIAVNGVRVMECAWTGLGAVLVNRSVFDKLYETALPAERYASYVMPGKTAVALFRSEVVAAREYVPDAPEDVNTYFLDDRVFSRRVRAAGIQIHAAIDVPTCHDGMRGCFAEELEKFERSQAPKQRLIGPDGKPMVGADGKSMGANDNARRAAGLR